MSGLGRRPPQAFDPARAESPSPKLTLHGRNLDGSLSLRVTLAGASNTFTLSRGPDMRPLQFEGEIVAEVERDSGKANLSGLAVVHRAAIYRTRGGKYVSEFSSQGNSLGERTGKADVFGTLDEACDWFRPGPLTTELLKKLGRWKPEIID